MTHLLYTVYSLPFVVGALVGLLGQRIYCWQRARWLDANRPNQNGTRHPVGGLDRMWLGGLAAVAILGYVLLQAQQTHDDTVGLSKRTAQCQADLIASIDRGRDIGAQNDDLSVRQRAKLAEINDVTGTWINRLINPPPDIAVLDTDDPRRQAWGIDVTRVYFERQSALRQEVDKISAEQRDLARQRNENALPNPRCGQ